VTGRNPEYGNWKIETGNWKMENGDWKLETGSEKTAARRSSSQFPFSSF
jgi:hypothetical protein